MSTPLAQLQILPDGPTRAACHRAATEGLQSTLQLLGLDEEGTVDTDHCAYQDSDSMVSIAFDTSGGAEGNLILLLAEAEALKIARLLLNRFGGPHVLQFDKHARNALSEIGNILASSFLNHLSGLVHTSCLPSVPELHVGLLQEVLPRAIKKANAPWANFSLHLGEAQFSLLFHPTEQTSQSLARAK